MDQDEYGVNKGESIYPFLVVWVIFCLCVVAYITYIVYMKEHVKQDENLMKVQIPGTEIELEYEYKVEKL